jgi:hypothetical protein
MARWEDYLDQESKNAVFQQANAETAQKNRPTSVIDPLVTERVSYINNRAPWLPPNTQVALAKSYASDQAVDHVAGLAAKQMLIDPSTSYTQLQSPPRSYWVTPSAIQARVNVGQGKKNQDIGLLDELGKFPGALYNAFKQTSRVATALSTSVGEGINDLAALKFDQLGPLNAVLNPFYGLSKNSEGQNQNIKTAAGSLSLFQLLNDWGNQGDGFFMSEDMMAKQAEAARQFRGTINGSAFTIGRGAAATVFDPGSRWYNTVSGAIDIGIAIAAPDPNAYVIEGIRYGGAAAKGLNAARKGGQFVDAFQSAKGIIPLVSQTDATKFAEALHKEAGLEKSLTGMSLDIRKWNNFMDNNTVALKAMNDIIDTQNPEDILKKFKGRITLEEASDLAKAKTSEQVKEVLVNRYAIGKDTLSTSIYDIQPTLSHNPGQYIVQRTPLKRSRLLMHMPARDVIINGDDAQRSQSVLNMINSIENAGGTPDDVRKFSEKAFKLFNSTSSADDQRDAYKVYEDAVRVVLGRNGVSKEVQDLVFGRARHNMQNMRTYMLNRMGVETDNALMQTYVSQLRKHFPDTVYSDMVEKIAETGTDGFGIARPMQLSELFDRVQTMPDNRELRRLTSNPLINEALSKVGLEGKPTKFLTSKWRKIEVTEYLDDVRAKDIKDELNKLRSKTRTNADNLKLESLKNELESITKVSTKLKYTGEANMGVNFLDVMQNQIWKPLQLVTIGYAMRNSIDAQVRMAFGGSSGFLNHPLEYMTLLLGETKSSNKLLKLAKKSGFSTMERSILGDALTTGSGDLLNNLRDDHRDLLGLDLRKQGLGASDAALHGHRTNNWAIVSKQSGGDNYVRGVINQIRLSNSDELQSIVARGRVLGLGEDEIMQQLLATAKTRKILDNIDGIYKRGVPFKDKLGREVFGPARSIKGLEGKALDEWLSTVHLKPVVVDNVSNLAGGYDEMNFMIAFDRVPMFDKSFVSNVNKLSPKYASEEKLAAGMFVKLDDGQEGIITRLNKDTNEATVVPVHAGSASKGNFGHKEARKFINKAEVFNGVEGSPGLPQQVAMEVLNMSKKESDVWLGDVKSKMDQMTNFLFNDLYGQKFVKTTERSPVFRRFYYDSISENIGRLSKSEAKQLIDDLTVKAQEEFGGDIGKYIGSKEAAQKLIQQAKVGIGNVTSAQLDDYARLYAINKTKDLLYDASDKNNLEDVLRIVAPFVSAWKEVLGNYVSLMIEDPTVATRFGRFSNMLMHSDPDKDGRGFWYKDPQTNQMYFKFPAIFGMPSWGLEKLTGVMPFFEAPVSQLSQGMSWLPGLGPIAQLPASFLLRNKPDTDWLVQMLMPYGKITSNEAVGSLNPLPPTATKVGGVIRSLFTNSEDQMGTAFSSAYVEILRVRYATGQYDLNKEEDLKRLKSDTKRDAQTITLLRAAQQFIGPTSPQVGYKVKAQGKDVYVDEMAKVFEKMQNENYDTAVQRFLKVFGDEMALYVGSKTKSLVPGLEASREFGEWEFKNGDLLSKYKDVAAYMAPAGSELNFDVWKRQLGQGKRKKLTDDELIALSQNRIGSAKYREARLMFGQFPNDAQRAQLDAYRASLNEQYPGFPRYAQYEVGKFPNQIDQLTKLVDDPLAKDNALAPIVKEYLNTRKIYLAQAGGKSFDSKKAVPAKMYMYNYGNQLAQQYPEFDRIWQRLLIQEVEN